VAALEARWGVVWSAFSFGNVMSLTQNGERRAAEVLKPLNNLEGAEDGGDEVSNIY
jgi:hypothetical protein